jgi:hypothetical protein
VAVDGLLSALVGALVAVAVIAALLPVVYRRLVRRRLTDELLRVSGPSIVRALLPQQVMTTFLSEIYGDSEAAHDVVAGVLGGEGVEPHFATCDPLLRDSITLACRLALFESWFVADRSLFDQSVDAMLPSVNIGICYTDLDGGRHDVAPANLQLTEVGFRDWPDFLTFFRGPVGTMPRQNPAQYIGTLRIFECDLGELTDVDHAVGSVESLSLRWTSLGRIDDGFCFWQAPYPCYVDRITFDASKLAINGMSWVFQVLPFTFRSATATGGWTPPEQLKDLAVRSWLLPGHGVAFLWKPGEQLPH